MTMRARWFFFYGTLAQEHENALTRAILPLLTGGRRATVRGRLWAVRSSGGWYPALGAGRGLVWGRIYRAGPCFSSKHLRLLDTYEDYDLQRPARSEYRRRQVRVGVAGGGSVMAAAYIYNRPVHAGQRVIAGGDFAAFIARHGLPAFGAD